MIAVDENGYVRITKPVSSEEKVTLTATISYGTTSVYIKTYEVTISPLPQTEEVTSGNVTILDAPLGNTVSAVSPNAEEEANYTLAVEGNEGYDYVVAYDITLKDGETTVQPENPVTVRIAGTFDTTRNYKVYHVNGNTTTEITPITVTPTYIEFKAAHFSVYAIAVEKYSVEIEYEDSQVTIEGASEYASENEKIIVTLTPKTGYQVASVKVNGKVIEGLNNVYQITITSDTTIIVIMEKTEHNVEVSMMNGTYTINPSSPVEYGTVVSLTVMPAEGYEVVSVKVGAETLTINNGVYTYTVVEDTTITVTTASGLKYEIEVSVSEAVYKVSYQYDKEYEEYIKGDMPKEYSMSMAPIELPVIDRPGYFFYGWQINPMTDDYTIENLVTSIPEGLKGNVVLRAIVERSRVELSYEEELKRYLSFINCFLFI